MDARSDDADDPSTDDEVVHEPGEITYAEHLHPARPRALRHRARVRSPFERRSSARDGEPVGTNPTYVSWLLSESMLTDANTIARQFSGQGSMWQNPYADPNPRLAVDTASVWFTAYPLSLITRPGQSFLAALGDEELWSSFADIGIEAVHTGPVKRAGGISGWGHTPSVDGHFDRISTVIDPAFGSEQEFRAMCGMATFYGGTIIDDVVPGHTGKGADFRLAEMGFADYPGIYHMVEIEPDDWHYLPDVPAGRDSINLDAGTEERLEKAGYIIGRLQRVIFHAPGVKETNWSATAAVAGVDGVERRWVYLHYFKEGQPSINWLDPSFAGMRLTIGDALHSLADLGSGALRLDANGFLGIEKSAAEGPAWSEGHPLSEAANHLIASMVRKVGGFTFQELNLTMDDIREVGEAGADLSYDFVTRPAYHHALATGDTDFLRLCLRTSLDGHRPGLARPRPAEPRRDDLRARPLVDRAPRRRLHLPRRARHRRRDRRHGAPRARDRARRRERPLQPGVHHQRDRLHHGHGDRRRPRHPAPRRHHRGRVVDIRRVHLLLAMYNAMQPGVFALSGWDLCGMLTLPPEQVSDLLAEGDTRWIHRAAHDLMGHNPDATRSAEGMPRGRSLYGSVPDQLADEASFLRQLQAILGVRKHYGIATSRQVDVPDVSHRSVLVLVHALDTGEHPRHALTILNFGAEPVPATVRSTVLPPGGTVIDMFTQETVGVVDDLHSVGIDLNPHQGVAMLVQPAI